MRSVARRVQFVNQLMRLESDYLEEGEGGGRRGEERLARREADLQIRVQGRSE